jgi:hypothetical protein
MRFSSPSGFTRRCSRSPQRVKRPPPMEFLPLQRIQQGESTRPGFTSPGKFRLQGFLTLLTACSSPCLPALFHAGNAHGVPPFRGFPSQGAARPRRKRDTLLTFLPTLCLQPRTEGGGRPLPRHLGFREGPFGRLQGFCLPKSPFTSTDTIRFRRQPVPSWAFSSLGFTPPAQTQRISPPLLSRASAGFLPERQASQAIHLHAPQSIPLRRGRLPSFEGSEPL